MLLLLAFSAVLLGSAAASPVVCPMAACTAKVTAEQQRLQLQMSDLQERHQQQISALQEGFQQQMPDLQEFLQQQALESQERLDQEIAAMQERHQQQISALQEGLQQQTLALQEGFAQEMSALQGRLQQEMSIRQERLDQEMLAVQERLDQEMSALQEQLTAIQQQLDICQECPANWSRRGDDCLLIPAQNASWNEALETCASLDGRARLASVHQANRDHVASVLSDNGAQYVWVGLSRPSGDDVWSWADGTALDFINWYPKEPNNALGNEECAVGYGQDEGARWNDDVCSRQFPFLCQISLD